MLIEVKDIMTNLNNGIINWNWVSMIVINKNEIFFSDRNGNDFIHCRDVTDTELERLRDNLFFIMPNLDGLKAVSYTHLTLPTN